MIVEDPVEKLKPNLCGPFQLYFFENLFIASEKGKILEQRKLTKKTSEVLLNKIFATEPEQNDTTEKEKAIYKIKTLDVNNNKFQICTRKNILDLFKIIDFGQRNGVCENGQQL